MTRRRTYILLFFTLTLNAALVCFLVSANVQPRARRELAEKRRIEALATQEAASRLAVPAKSVPLSPAIASELKGLNDDQFVERLKRERFPPKMVRALAQARIYDQHYDKRRELRGGKEVPYWKAQYGRYYEIDPTDHELVARERALARETVAQLDRLDELGLSSDPTDLAEQRDFKYGNISETKIRRLEAMERDYRELRREYWTRDGDIALPEDAEKLKFLEQERRKDLVALLSPEELENYELRSSETARGLKNQLASFDPSQDEYKAVFRAQRAFDEKYGDKQLGIDEARELREAEMRKALSPERFDDYKIKTSGSYAPVRELVASLHLPESTIAETIRFQQDTMKRAMEIRADSSLTSNEIAAKLNAMADEATAKLNATFGEEGFLTYSGQAGGWIKRLRTGTP